VDFAASMIDGRTVGEVVPNSQSAREVTELWLYIQGKLSRIVRDPALLPEVRPEHLSINALLSTGTEHEAEAPPPVVEPPVLEVAVFEGPERRAGIERRVLVQPRPIERRAFGRRAGEFPPGSHWGIK